MKNVIKFALTFMVISILTGCVSTQEVANNVASKYVGQDTDRFFLDHGAPTGKHQLNNGDVIWTWDSGKTDVPLPQATTIVGTNDYGNANYTALSNGGGTVGLQCVLQIVSDKRGTIKNVRIMKDTTGLWTTSMCHEVLE